MPERKTLNKDLFYRGSSANLPRLHTCKNKVPFWDFSQFAITLVCKVCCQMWEKKKVPLLVVGGSSSMCCGGARGVIVIVTGYGHGDPSSIPGQD